MITTIAKVKSGVEGFDQLLDGGFPIGRSYLVSGEPGTGKTIFSLQFLLEGLKSGENCVYVSIDEKPENIILDAESLGWDLKPFLDRGRLHFLDVTDYFSSPKVASSEGIDVQKVVNHILEFIQQKNARRVAIDPVSPLVFTDNSVPDVVEYIRQLIIKLEDLETCTTLLTSYVPVGSDKVSQHGIEEFASSGIILLKLNKLNNRFTRTIRIRKMRRTKMDLTEYSYDILLERGLVLRQPV